MLSAGLYAGIKFFIIDFLFKSCPKLRDKYDTPYIVWNSLPTDPQLKERTVSSVSRRVSGQNLTNTNPFVEFPLHHSSRVWDDALQTKTSVTDILTLSMTES